MRLPSLFAALVLACPLLADELSDTWVATDGLGRSLPTFAEVGGPRTNRSVVVFYFLTLGQHGDYGPLDVSKIQAKYPDAMTNPARWGTMYAHHFWAEPLFGYYLATDRAVIRKHAQMLADAGVDAIAFDVSNGFLYPEAHTAVFETFAAVRAAGGKTPQIFFWLPFDPEPSRGNLNMRYSLLKLWRTIYSKGRWSDLWFRWQGKPLIVSFPDYARPAAVNDRATSKPYGDEAPEGTPEEEAAIRGFFTFRKPFPTAHGMSEGHRKRGGWWTWRQIFPQTATNDEDGNLEEISVSVSQNCNAERTIAASHPECFSRAHCKGTDDPTPENLARGLNFQEQWDRALELAPPLVFVTGWNEWTAGRYPKWEGYAAPAVFPDSFDPAHSRDAEPVTGFWGDAYYYQLAANVRRYKGVREIPLVQSRPIAIDGRFDDWQAVGPSFRDTPGDPVKRHFKTWGRGNRIDDDTGRNDIVEAKVSADGAAVSFYVRTAAPLKTGAAENWMVLFVDADADPKTGWLGYDFAVRPGAAPADVRVATGVSEIELSVPLAHFGGKLPRQFDFKWADNCLDKTDWSDFTLHGDAAPNDRYNYRARFSR